MLWRGHITSTAPHKAGNIAPIQGRASPWQGVKGDSVPFAEHETESRPERSSGQGAAAECFEKLIEKKKRLSVV